MALKQGIGGPELGQDILVAHHFETGIRPRDNSLQHPKLTSGIRRLRLLKAAPIGQATSDARTCASGFNLALGT